MSKKENGDDGMTEEELRRQFEEDLQNSKDDYWLMPINEDRSPLEREEELYHKQVQADEAYWENKLLEQLEMEEKLSEDMEGDFDDEEEDFDHDDEPELDVGDLDFLDKEDGPIKKDKTDVDDDEELEL